MSVRPLSKLIAAAGASLATAAMALPALASRPEPDGIWLQPPATTLAEEVHFFHDVVLMPVITFISLFVLALLVYVVVKFNSKANPVAQKFSHNTFIEIVWTVIPIFILLYISLFSFDLLYKEDVIPDGKRMTYVGDGQTVAYTVENDFEPKRSITKRDHVEVFTFGADGARSKLSFGDDYTLEGLGDAVVTVAFNAAPAAGTDIEIIGGRSRTGVEPFLGLFGEDRSEIVAAPGLTIKATGRQWGWNYNYPDYGDFEILADLVQKEDLADPSLYLLQATNNIVVPEGETVRIITTATDVIHAWTIPAFAIKVDAVPGRLNETWFKAPAPGMYYGQCSEICGIDHAYMPISLEVKSRADFEAWVTEQQEFAGLEPTYKTENQVRFAGAANEAALQQ